CLSLWRDSDNRISRSGVFTSPPISEALSDHASNGHFGAVGIIYAKGDAVAVAEIELGKVAVQVLLGDVLVDALHAALEDRIVAFDRVGVDAATRPFIVAVIHGLMRGEQRADATLVERRTVR